MLMKEHQLKKIFCCEKLDYVKQVSSVKCQVLFCREAVLKIQGKDFQGKYSM